MPPRWLSVGIIAGWLAAMGWLFWHDLWPRWQPGEPPPFYIDLVEEVGNNQLMTHWNVQLLKKDEATPTDIFEATTRIYYRQEDDTFTLHSKMKVKGKVFKAKGKESKAKEKDALAPLKFKVESLTSNYRVNRTGELRELWSEVNLKNSRDIQLTLRGEVHDEQFRAHCQAIGLAETPVEMDLPPVPVSHNASVLLPLHPVNRIHGLRPGQSWRQPLVDPIRDAFSLLGGGGVRYLNARVLPQPQVLKEDDSDKTTCLVIEYTDEDGHDAGRTWVEQDSERVLQQEAVLDGDRWIMKRDNPRRPPKRTPHLPRMTAAD